MGGRAGRSGPGQPRTPERVAVDVAIRLGLLAVFSYFSLVLLRPFLALFLWSVVMAVAFYPAFDWLRRRLDGRGSLAAGIVTAVALLIVLGPTTVLISSLIHSLETLASSVGAGRAHLPPPPELLARIPVVGETLTSSWSQASSNLEAFLGRYGRALLPAGEWLLKEVARLGGSAAVILAAVLVSGFLLVPGPRLARACRTFAARVSPTHGSDFVDLSAATIRNVARGVLGVSCFQALLVGLGLIAAGVPQAGLLSLVSLILAIVQIGVIPVVVLVLLWAWFHLSTVGTLVLAAYLIPVGLSDSPLKALLMGKGLHTPLLVILAGVIGGTMTYGLVGLFLGPILLAVFYDLLMFWVAEPEEGRGGIE